MVKSGAFFRVCQLVPPDVDAATLFQISVPYRLHL